MTTPILPLLATSELVAMAWIGSIEGLSAGMVATQLPDVSQWAATGFITVAVVGGSPNIYLPVKKPVLQVDCWAVKPESVKPLWWRANLLAETIRYATLQRKGFNRILALTSGAGTYPAAVVQSAYLATEPRRIYSDPGAYARYQMDLALTWVTVGDQIP